MSTDRLRERLLLLGGLVVLVVVGVVLAAGNGDDRAPDDSAPDDSAPEDSAPDDTAPDTDPAPIDAAGPLDGLESLQLPVAVDPADDLVDEQTVEISGSGFTAGATIAMVQCWLGEDGGSRDDCDLGNIGIATADPQGAFVGMMVVHRFIDTENGVFDCASGGTDEGCRIGVANTVDLDESGGVSVFFAPQDAVEPPTIEATPTTGLRDGDPIALTGTGFEPGGQVEVTQCPVGGMDDASGGCTSRNPGEIVDIGPDGGLEMTVVAARQRVSEDGPHDCALEVHGCMIVVRALASIDADGAAVDCDAEFLEPSVDEQAVDCGPVYVSHRSPNPIPLVFDPGVAPAVPSEYTVTPSQGLVDGSSVRLEVFDMPADGSFVVAQCADGGPRGLFCDPRGVIEVTGGSGAVDVIVVATLTEADDAIDCTEPARRCYLALDGALADEVRGPLRFAS